LKEMNSFYSTASAMSTNILW